MTLPLYYKGSMCVGVQVHDMIRWATGEETPTSTLNLQRSTVADLICNNKEQNGPRSCCVCGRAPSETLFQVDKDLGATLFPAATSCISIRPGSEPV